MKCARSTTSAFLLAFATAISAAGTLCYATPAHAVGQQESETFFARGRELRLAGKCEEAIEQFRLAYDAYSEGLGALRNIAECEEELKRPASARRSWWSLRVAVKQSDSDKYIGWDKEAEAAFARLAGQVAKVVVKVKNANGGRILVNGRPLNPTLQGTELEQDLGEIVVVLEDGAVPVEKKLVLEAGKTYQIELEGTGKGTYAPNSGPNPLIISGGVALGVAGLALGGLIGAVVVRQQALSKIDEECQSYTNCDPSLQEEEDRGALASTLFNAFAIGGGIAAAAGTGLMIAGFVTSQKGDSASPPNVPATVGIAPLPGGFYIGVDGKF